MQQGKGFNYKNIEAIAFDLFNTLVYVDSPTRPYKWLFDILSLSEQERQNVKKRILTNNTTKITSGFPRKYCDALNPLNAEFKKRVDTEVNSAKLYPDTMSVLNILSSALPLYLISNLATPYKEVVYKLGIDKYFTSILFSCDRKVAKPSPKIFSQLKEVTRLPSSKILMVGDSYTSDYLGSQNAGLKSILIKRTFSSSDQPRQIEQIRTLAPLIKFFT